LKRSTVIVLFVVAMLYAWTHDVDELATVPEPPAEAQTDARAPLPTPTDLPAVVFAVGQDVLVGDVRWKVLSAVDEGQQLKSRFESDDPKPTVGKWVRVRFEIENMSKAELDFTGVDLTDEQGRTFQRARGTYSYVPNEEDCSYEQLNANVPKTCQLVFELPGDAVGLKMIVGDLELLDVDEAAIDLGL